MSGFLKKYILKLEKTGNVVIYLKILGDFFLF